MAQQLTDKFSYLGGYADGIMSVETIDELKKLSRSQKFVGLTTTVLKALTSSDGLPIPADFWLSESKSGWELKSLGPIYSLDQLSVIPSEYIPKGFEVLTKDGKKFSFDGVDDNGDLKWIDTETIINNAVSSVVDSAIEEAVNRVTSGATEAFDTLKEIEDWIKTNSGSSVQPDLSHLATKEELEAVEAKIPSVEGLATKEWVDNQGFIKEHQDISHLATSADVANAIEEIKSTIPSIEGLVTREEFDKLEIPSVEGLATKDEVEAVKSLIPSTDHLATSEDVANAIEKVMANIPSIDGLATETYVKNAIAEAQLSGGDIDLSGYATKDDIKDLAHKDDVKTYTEGTSISIDETNKISVKIAKDTEEKENFIEVNEDNELVLNSITLDAAVISEDIEVNGGAWADEVETVFDGKIPAGITFEQFLKKMLKKEKFASNFNTTREFSVTLGEINPGIIASDKNINGEIVEIGTRVVIGEINPTTTKAIQSLSAGTFTYGYKIGENGSLVNSQVYTEKLKPILTKTASTLQVLFTNLTSDIEGTTALENIFKTKDAEEDIITIEPIVAYVNKGYNSVTICQTGNTYAANTSVVGSKIYAATSLGNFYTNDEVTDNVYNVVFPETELTAMNQTIYQVTGSNKYFIGGISEYSKDYWNTNRSEEIRGLEEQGWASGNTIEIPYIFKEGTKQQTVAVPSEYTKVFGRDRLSGPVEFKLVNSDMNFYNSQGYVSKYNVFVAPVVDGLSVESFINITISKS